jgi:hypothetical protein
LFLLTWGIGFPISLIIYLSRLYAQGHLHSLRNRARFGYLIIRYGDRYWMCTLLRNFAFLLTNVIVSIFAGEFVIMLRKATIVILLVFFSQQESKFDQVSLAFFSIFIFLAVQVMCSPYVERRLNVQESVALLTHVICFFIGLAFLSGSLPLGSVNAAGVGWALILFISGVAIYLAAKAYYEVKERLHL